MNKVVHRLKASVVGVALASTLVGVGGVVVVGTAIAASQTMVTTTTVNMRSGPGSTYAVVDVVDSGARVTATGSPVTGPSASNSTWTPVTYNGQSGYIATVYLSVADAADPGGTASGSAADAVTNTDVNIRSGPGTTYSIVATVDAGTSIKTTGVTSGSWSQVLYQDVKRWMYTAYLTISGSSSGSSTTYGQVRTTDNVYLRSEGYYGATILATVPADSIVDVTGQTTDAYTQIVYQGQKGWIASAYTVVVSSGPQYYSSGSSSNLTAQQKKLVDYVRAQVGDAYVWGAEGPNSFDCSGLTMMAYRQIGISLPHHSATQATLGKAVTRANLQPGDLIFWYSPVSHVSMYVGNGMMVHARNTAVGVVEQSVDSYINAGGLYNSARRYIS